MAGDFFNMPKFVQYTRSNKFGDDDYDPSAYEKKVETFEQYSGFEPGEEKLSRSTVPAPGEAKEYGDVGQADHVPHEASQGKRIADLESQLDVYRKTLETIPDEKLDVPMTQQDLPTRRILGPGDKMTKLLGSVEAAQEAADIDYEFEVKSFKRKHRGGKATKIISDEFINPITKGAYTAEEYYAHKIADVSANIEDELAKMGETVEHRALKSRVKEAYKAADTDISPGELESAIEQRILTREGISIPAAGKGSPAAHAIAGKEGQQLIPRPPEAKRVVVPQSSRHGADAPEQMSTEKPWAETKGTGKKAVVTKELSTATGIHKVKGKWEHKPLLDRPEGLQSTSNYTETEYPSKYGKISQETTDIIAGKGIKSKTVAETQKKIDAADKTRKAKSKLKKTFESGKGNISGTKVGSAKDAPKIDVTDRGYLDTNLGQSIKEKIIKDYPELPSAKIDELVIKAVKGVKRGAKGLPSAALLAGVGLAGILGRDK